VVLNFLGSGIYPSVLKNEARIFQLKYLRLTFPRFNFTAKQRITMRNENITTFAVVLLLLLVASFYLIVSST